MVASSAEKGSYLYRFILLEYYSMFSDMSLVHLPKLSTSFFSSVASSIRATFSSILTTQKSALHLLTFTFLELFRILSRKQINQPVRNPKNSFVSLLAKK